MFGPFEYAGGTRAFTGWYSKGDIMTEVENVVQPVVPEDQKEFVPRKDHENVLKDMHVFKTKVRDLETKLKTEEDNKLKEKEQWKTLYEKESDERQKAEEKSSKLEESYINSQKFSSLKSECLKLGILDSAMVDLDMIDLGQLKIETTSMGRVHVLNSKEVSEDVKRTRPHWFGNPNSPKINTSSPQVINSSEVNLDNIKKLEEQWKKTRSSQDEAAYKKGLLALKVNLRR